MNNTKFTPDLLQYILTRDEYEQVRQLTLRRSGLKLPELNAEKKPSTSFYPSVSRRAIRLFLATYALTNLVENVAIGALRRKKLSEILKNLASSSSLRLAAFIASYSAIYRLLLHRIRLAIPRYLPPPSLSPNLSTPNTPLIGTTTNGRPQLRRGQSNFSRYRPKFRKTMLKIAQSALLPPFLAGVGAAPTMLLEAGGQRRITIALYALTRASQGGYDAACGTGLVPRAMREGRWWWGGHLIFALSNAILLHAFVFNPETFPQSYSSFILRYSSAYLPSRPSYLPASAPWPAPREIVDAIGEAARRGYPNYISPILHPASSASFVPSGALEKIVPVLAETHAGHEKLVCSFLHPGEPKCWNIFDGFVKSEFKGAAKFFGVLAILGSGLRWRKSLKDPEGTIFKMALGTLTSSAFLSLSIGSAWSSICFFQHFLPNSFLPTKRFYLQGFLAGLWVALVNVGSQDKGRATDLGIYTARLAIQCAWDVLVKSKKMKSIKNGEVIYFALSMGALMSMFETHPQLIKSNFVRSALRNVGGKSTQESPPREEEAVEGGYRVGP